MTRVFEVRPAQTTPESHQSNSSLEVVALFTTEPATVLALQTAAKLASGLSARIRLVVPQVVPYPLPIEEPQANSCVFSRRICAIAGRAGVECMIDIRLCREREVAIEQALPARSIVVIGSRPRWWSFRDRTLLKRLLHEGRQIAYAEGGRIHA
jgi:hypothetical protein